MELIVPVIAKFVNIYIAGKLFLLLSVALILSGVQAVHYSIFGKWSVGPLIAAVIIYNQVMAWGVNSYIVGIGVALWGIALTTLVRERHPVLRVGISLAFAAMTFLCHLAALGLYGLGTLVIELWMTARVWRVSRRTAILNAAIFVLPFVVVPVLMALGPTTHHVGSLQWLEGCQSGNVPRCFVSHKVGGLWTVFTTGANVTDAIAAVLMAAAGAWCWWRNWLRIHPIALWFVALAALIYVAMPTSIFGGGKADLRLPVGMAFIVIALLDWRFPTRKSRYAFLAILFALVTFRVGSVVDTWQQQLKYKTELDSSIQLIAPGSKVLVARSLEAESIRTLYYEPCLAIIERSSLVSLAFSDPTQQVLIVDDEYRDMAGGYNDNPISVDELMKPTPVASIASPSGRIYWRNWK